ncbi:PilZ domain-containing protein [Brevundimonas diminuta]|uniref:PilZ domain-containing protein n=1 Tax=Brevundimonas diminuta TaxID=293 RepID=UPI0039C85712
MAYYHDLKKPANAQEADRRDGSRRSTFFSGRIAFNSMQSTINCTVRNLSDTGACLEVSSALHVPSEFHLIVDSVRFRADCRVVWRRGKKLGVVCEGVS